MRKAVLAALIVVLGALALAMTAFADDAESDFHGKWKLDPQTTNIPYTAWIGDEVQLEKCIRFKGHEDLTASEVATLQTDLEATIGISANGTFNILNYSDNGPVWQEENGTGRTVTVPPEINKYGLCWNANLISTKAGLSTVEFTVNLAVLLNLEIEIFDGLELDIGPLGLFNDNVLKHKFLVIYMIAGKPALYEVAAKDYFGGWSVADEAGDGVFTPPFDDGIDTFPGRGCKSHDFDPMSLGADEVRHRCHFNNGIFGLVKINLTGSFPYAGESWTLPDDWAALASLLAFDVKNGQPGSVPYRWDIHDDNSLGHGLDDGKPPAPDPNFDGNFHTKFNFCPYGENKVDYSNASPGAEDVVDNCRGGKDDVNGTVADFWDGENDWHSNLGPFSNVYFGAWKVIGPFDPIRPWQTFLPDGKIDWGDAPMPPLRLNVWLQASGPKDPKEVAPAPVGALDKVDKDDVYVFDPTYPDETPGNLYAPFYKAFIPPVTPGSGRSGVYGGEHTNNFPGFITDGKYDYWSIAGKVWRDGENGCYAPFNKKRHHYGDDGDVAADAAYETDYRGSYGTPYPWPTGYEAVTVYTDEHGEAFVKFLPYRGAILSPDSNGLCDFPGQGVRELGRADIKAQAEYSQPNTGDEDNPPIVPAVSDPLTKVVNHLATKKLQCVPKSAGTAYCVETILDFNGDPVKGVKVRFSASANASPVDVIAAFLNTINDPYKMVPSDASEPNNPDGGNFDTTDQYKIDGDQAESWVEVITGHNGQAGIEVYTSHVQCVNVTAENVKSRNGGFGVRRDLHIPLNGATGCRDTLPGADDGGTGVKPPPEPKEPPANGNGGDNGNGGNGGNGGSPANGGSSTTTGGSASTVVSLGGPVIQATPVLTGTRTATIASANARLFSVKVLQSQFGRFLVVNVKANKNAKKAKVLFLVKNKTGKLVKTWRTVPSALVRIQILNDKGKVIGTVTRRVAVNKAYKIENLKLPKAAASVRTSVIA
jgi:hypothetical protein